MGGITNTPENRYKLKNMTLEKWNEIALESQYRWILLCRKLVSEGRPDYLEKIGIDAKKKALILGERSQNRQNSADKEKMKVIESHKETLGKNKRLVKRVSTLEDRVSELEEQLEQEKEVSTQRYDDLHKKFKQDMQRVTAEMQSKMNLQKLELQEEIRDLRDSLEQILMQINAFEKEVLKKLEDRRKFEEQFAIFCRSPNHLNDYDDFKNGLINQINEMRQKVTTRVSRS